MGRKRHIDPANDTRTLPGVCELLEAAVNGSVAPGMSAVVTVRGELAHHSTHGYAQLLPTPRALSPSSVFDVASLTKVLCTTSLAAMLYDSGQLRLDLPIGHYLPLLSHRELGAATPRQLLAHNSGLVWWRPYYEEVARDPVAGGLFREKSARPAKLAPALARARELVIQAVAQEPLVSPNASRVVYSDVGFIVLGFLLEAIAGSSLTTLFAEQVAKPLALTRTFFVDPEAKLEDDFAATEACIHRHEVNCGAVNDDNAWALGGTAGHAGLFSHALESARIGQEWLNALHQRSALFSTDTARLFAAPVRGIRGGRALGWDTASVHCSTFGARLGQGPRGAIGHLGFTGTSLWIDIDREIVCVLFTNRIHLGRDHTSLNDFRPRFHDAIADAIGI